MIDVGFTGSQYSITGTQKNVLATFLEGFRDIGAVWMRNGDCIMADEFAGRTWLSLGGAIHLHPPSNPSKRAFLNELPMVVSSPPRPYLERNQDIARASTVMLSTPRDMKEQTKGGTWYTINAARKLLLPLAIIWPEGPVSYERWPDKLSDFRDSDGAATAAVCEDIPVPKDCQARASNEASPK